MRIGSVFSGIGGIELGLERAGLGHVVWQIEIDPFCRAILEKHWPNATRYEDVRTATALPGIDLLCGGFPCQPFSVSGNRRGHEDDRYLWPEMFRIVRELRPRWVVAENVPGLRTLGADEVLEDLESEGYATWPIVVGADDVGAPHRRKRVWIVATLRVRELLVPDTSGTRPRMSVSADRGVAHRSVRDDAPDSNDSGRQEQRWTCAGAAEFAFAEFAGRWPARSLSRGDADGIPARVDRLRALGNSVVPQVAEAIGRAILESA